jgi:hypothetical protein
VETRVLCFQAAGHGWAVPLADMLRVVPEVELLAMPLPPAGLAGVMPDQEGVVAVYDLDALARGGRASTCPTGDALVGLFPHPGGAVGVRLERLHGLAGDLLPLGDSAERTIMDRLDAGLRPVVAGVAGREGHPPCLLFSRDGFMTTLAGPR